MGLKDGLMKKSCLFSTISYLISCQFLLCSRMSARQRQAVLYQQAANDQAHQAKINEQRALHEATVKKFDADLNGLDRALEENLRRAKNVATDHQDVMNKLVREESEIVREKTSMHSELMKEMGKNANRDIGEASKILIF